MKRNACNRIFPVLATLLAAVAAQTAAADGAVLIKGGAVLLSDDTQLIDNVLASIDDVSARTFAVSLEHRTRRHGMAFGIEYTSYRHDYTTVVSTEPGDTRTQVLQFIVRKYFYERSPVRPFIGIGIGGGYTQAEFRQGGVLREDDIGSFVLQGALGAEFRIENLSLMLEVKRFWHDPGSSDDYNATASGLFGGIGFNW